MTTLETSAKPPIVSREEWEVARQDLLAREKAHTRAKDALSAARRRLPMVEVRGDYVFDGPDGERTLADLFEGRQQLIVQHFMFHPDWERGCPSCTATVDNIGTIAPLHEVGVTFALIARAPYEKLQSLKAEKGWPFPFYSSGRSTFNRDFGVTVEEDSEIPGMSVFLRDGDTVYQTYATGGRGVEAVIPEFGFMDMTVYGRQQDWEDSPPGWPQRPTYG